MTQPFTFEGACHIKRLRETGQRNFNGVNRN